MIIRCITIVSLFFCLTIHTAAQPLNDALDKRDTVLAAAIIKGGYDVNSVDKTGASALLGVCHVTGNDTSFLCFLMRYGAKPDLPRSPKGRTALIVVCAYYGGVPACRVLLNAGADVNAVTKEGTTALMIAAANNKADVIEYLLSMGAYPNLKDSYGKTALDYATASNLSDTVIKMMSCCRVSRQETLDLLTKAMK